MHNQTEEGRQRLRQRVVVEHRLARLVQLGIRQSRYVGRTKTRFQVVMAAVVANLSLVLGFGKRQAESIAPGAENAAISDLCAAVRTLWTRWTRSFRCFETAAA